MRILIDTNILIYREAEEVLSENQQNLSKILHKIGAEQIIHPLSLKEIEKNPDPKKKAIILSKVRAYALLESPPNHALDVKFNSKIPSKPGSNDEVDNALLYCVLRDAVDYLITEDRKIIGKASRLGVGDRVFLIADALEFFQKFIVLEKPIAPPSLEEDYIYNLDLADPIFDTLKADYSEFIDWFKKISRQGRKCWVHYNYDGSIGALLIYKIENEPLDTIPPFPKKKRVKISTFIVSHIGQKIGELFIKLAVDIAIKNKTEEIYLTHFTKPDDRLIELITEYGFTLSAKNDRGEEIYIKQIFPDLSRISQLSPLEISKEYYPTFYGGSNVNKFFVPIWPINHERLFTDFKGSRQTKLPEHSGMFIIEGNTIKKAYISHAQNLQISPGDLIFFYRSRDLSAVTSIGVVESVHRNIRVPDEIMKIVGKRTVYNRDEIEQMTKPVTIIMFRHHLHVKNLVLLNRLKELNILTFAPLTITKMYEEDYYNLIEACGIDRRFIVH